MAKLAPTYNNILHINPPESKWVNLFCPVRLSFSFLVITPTEMFVTKTELHTVLMVKHGGGSILA